jgi:hypothetical protein
MRNAQGDITHGSKQTVQNDAFDGMSAADGKVDPQEQTGPWQGLSVEPSLEEARPHVVIGFILSAISGFIMGLLAHRLFGLLAHRLF